MPVTINNAVLTSTLHATSIFPRVLKDSCKEFGFQDLASRQMNPVLRCSRKDEITLLKDKSFPGYSQKYLCNTKYLRKLGGPQVY